MDFEFFQFPQILLPAAPASSKSSGNASLSSLSPDSATNPLGPATAKFTFSNVNVSKIREKFGPPVRAATVLSSSGISSSSAGGSQTSSPSQTPRATTPIRLFNPKSPLDMAKFMEDAKGKPKRFPHES